MKYRRFEEWFEDFVRYNEDGHVKRTYVTPEGYKLGIWVYGIRTGRLKITEEQERCLAKAGFKWKVARNRMFEEWLSDFVRYSEDGNVKRRFVTPEGHYLGKWVNSVRNGKWKITEEQKAHLNKAGFKWEVERGRPFEEWFEDLVRYSEDGNVKRTFVTPEGYGLGNWVNGIRTGRLKITEEQKRCLSEVGFKWKVGERRTFEEWLKDFVRYNVDGNVKYDYVTPEGHNLGSWVNDIRAGKYKLKEEQRQQLMEVGFKWKVKECRTFEEWLADFVYYNVDGNVKATYVTPEGHNLGSWVNRIRKSKYKLTEEQKQQLNAVGFVWQAKRGRSKRT